MVSIDKAVIVKLKKAGKTYEILADCENALSFRSGKGISMDEVIVTEEIFYDAKKGIRASEHELEKVFGTDDKSEICKIIIKEGNIPLTAEILRKNMENKRKQVVDAIHRNAVDPGTGKPHPANRIDNAMNEAKVRIDENKTAEQQLHDIVDKIRKILPIKYEIREIMINVPANHASRAIQVIKKFGKLLGETWTNDGGLNATIEIPAGIQEELEVALNNIAKGTVDIKVLRTR